IDTSHYDASSGNNTDNTLHISAGYVDANGNYVDSLPGHDGDAASVNVNGDSGNAYGGTTGFGASSGVDGDGQDRFDEVNYLGDSHSQTSEALVISLAQDGKVATSATVNLAEFYPNESNIGDEQGAYRLYLNGQPVSDWISFTAENANGSLGLTINGPASGFDQIVFAGLPATSNPNGDQNGSDSSDFSIHDATFNVVDADSIGGTVSSAHGGLPLQLGADGPGHVDLIAHEATGLQYNGQDITETVQNGVLYGKAGDTVIYTLSLVHDQNGYHYQFDLAKPIDGSQTGHPITFDYSVTDNDGDKVGGCITVNIDDNNGVTVNLPTDAAGVTQVDEAGLAAGTHHGDGSNLADGHIAVNAPDGVTSIKLGGVTIPLDGTVVHITDGTRGTLDAHWNATDHTIDYTYTLTGPTTEGSDDQASFEVVVTDPQGDHNTGQNLVISIHDDAPTAQNLNLGTVQEGSDGVDGNVIFAAGADNLQSIAITKGNDGTQGTLTIDTDGKVHYTPPHNVDGDKSYTFEYTVTDKDGDQVTKAITVDVKDGVPTITHEDPQHHEPVVGPGDVTVDESYIPNAGSNWQPGMTDTVHGSFTVNGGDESITVTIDGHEIHLDGSSNAPITDQDGLGELQVTGVTKNSDGSYTIDYDYTLEQAKHNDANSDAFDTSFKVTVTDQSGDSADGDLTVHVIDDKPIASMVPVASEHLTIDETQGASTGLVSHAFDNVRDAGDALGWVTNQYIGVAGGFKTGADGLGEIHHALKIPAQGTDSGLTTTDGHKIFLYQDPDGVVVGRVADDAGNPNPSGEAAFAVSISGVNTVSVVQYEPLHHNDGTNPDDGVQLANGSLNVVLVVTDGDGDQGVSNAVDISHNITFKDDGPTAQDLSNTTPVHEGDANQIIGKVIFDAGTDGLQSIVVSSGNGQGHGTLSIDPDGTVHYQAPANVTGNQDYTFNYTVTDKDGDHVTKTITVHVGDDVPTISHNPGSNGGVLTLSESHLSDGTQPDASQLSKSGAFSIDTHGEGLNSIQINGNTVVAGSQVQGDKGVLVIDSITDNHDGTYAVAYHYTVTDNHELSNPNDTFNQDFNITVKDASGDTANSTITVHVTDDAPTASGLDLSSVDEGTSNNIGHVDFKAGADGLQSVEVTSGNDNGQGTLSIDADGKVHYTAPTDVDGAHDYTFEYKVTDKDGDTATNTITVHVNDTAKPVLIVGENVDDNSGQQKDHYIDHAPGDQNQGTINGGDAGDVLVGDVGGKSGQIAAGDYNICLILDVSTSMNDTFSGSGGKSRLDVMQAAVNELLAKYADHPGDVNIKIIAFGTDVVREWESNANGDFSSTTKDGNQTAVDFVNGLDSRGTQYTNYEAAMAAAKAWFDQVGNNGNTNKAYFLSDGDPTARLNNSGDPTDIDASPSNSQVEQYLSEAEGAAGSMLGTGNDGLHVDFQAIGIGSGVTKTNLDRFDNSGDTQTPGDAQIVTDASQLNDALDVGKAPVPFDQGDDVINGGKGNDLIFGDEVYTESINDNNPNTIGWQNFGNMTEAEIVAWLKANPDEAGKEYADAKYGNDTLMGGEGDDVIYGQGGDDIITGGKGTDQLHGGSGNDTYIWAVGDGNDTIMETAGLKDTLKITGTDTNPTLTRSGNDLIVTIGGETITVKGQFETDGDNNPDTNKAVEFIEVNGQTYRIELDQNGQPKLVVATSAPPVNTVPSSIVAVGTTTIPGVSVQDTDSQSLQVTLAVDHGVLAFASTLGLTVDYNGDHSQVTLSGDQTAINQALAGLQYTSDGHDATLTMVSKDSDGHTDTDHTSIHALTLDANLNLSTAHGSSFDQSVSVNKDYSDSDGPFDWFPQNSHITDNNGGHSLSGNGGNDWIEGGKGNDTLNGGDGNDYLDGGQGHDTYSGGAGNDVLVVDKDDLTGSSRLIDGGAGDDVLDLSAVGNWDFRANGTGDHGHSGISNIETLNLNGGGSSEQTITLDADSVLDMTDGRNTLVIQGNDHDNVTLNGDWNKVGSVTDHGHTYDVFQSGSGGNLATVIVDQLVHTTTPDHHG
ncbi:MAG: VWA domain-containing protein, partial [Nevskiaceae bacterium]